MRRLLFGAIMVCSTACEPGDPRPMYEESAVDYEGFSWVIEDKLAGMPQPGRTGPLKDNLAFLADEQIGLLASVNEVPPPVDEIESQGIDSRWWSVDDFQPPSQDQLLDFVAEVGPRFEAGERVGVHCTYGMGRTGTFLAVWLVVEGYEADTAIAEVRARRPGSIETLAQEDAVRTFWLNHIAGDSG